MPPFNDRIISQLAKRELSRAGAIVMGLVAFGAIIILTLVIVRLLRRYE